MSLLERLLRSLSQLDAPLREIRVDLPAGTAAPASLPAELLRALPVHFHSDDASAAECFGRAQRAAAGAPLLAVSADAVVDPRLLEHFFASSSGLALVGGEGDERCALLWLTEPLQDDVSQAADLVSIARRAVHRGAAKEFAEGDFEPYVRKLRRDLPPYLFRVADGGARKRAERFLFWSNYKGSTDFLTKHVYPPLVWLLLRPLARHRIHPNWVTGISWVVTVASVPLFAAGAWAPGLALSYVMSVLDSVDGKLARLTYTASRFGSHFDHALDVIHPPFWYVAWGYALGGGRVASAPFVASLGLVAVYAADRLLAPIFKSRTGRSIHSYTPLDMRMRTFIARRNISLATVTAGVAIDALAPGHAATLLAFYLTVAWQVASLGWHVVRVAQFWNDRARR
jgi:phosphatidylglycerophosphate synthase